jgi:hypothetical protein
MTPREPKLAAVNGEIREYQIAHGDSSYPYSAADRSRLLRLALASPSPATMPIYSAQNSVRTEKDYGRIKIEIEFDLSDTQKN